MDSEKERKRNENALDFFLLSNCRIFRFYFNGRPPYSDNDVVPGFLFAGAHLPAVSLTPFCVACANIKTKMTVRYLTTHGQTHTTIHSTHTHKKEQKDARRTRHYVEKKKKKKKAWRGQRTAGRIKRNTTRQRYCSNRIEANKKATAPSVSRWLKPIFVPLFFLFGEKQ